MSKKPIVARVTVAGIQKRLTIPKQKETEDWEMGDLVKLERVEVE